MEPFASVHEHYALVLIGLAIFPRITMLFVGGPFGVLHWLGWFFAPHITVAIIGTLRYWDTDPFLCAVAWVIALVGTGSEAESSRRVAVR